MNNNDISGGVEFLKAKALEVRRATLCLHKKAPGTRIASSLSDVELFVALYYGKILRYSPGDPFWDGRDRLIISKGHGAVSLYPILADLGFFPEEELEMIATEKSFLGVIPDMLVPGIETINGSLGNGIGVGAGMAMALKCRNSDSNVIVMTGDGEMNSGAIWESIMFAGHNKIDNLFLIIDNNKMSMLGYQKDIMGLEPFEDKFSSFGWDVCRTDGNDIEKLLPLLKNISGSKNGRPRAIIADTVKGKGVPELEQDILSHVRTLKPEEIDSILEEMK